MDTERLPQIIMELYRLTNELENMFPGRHFTPDGHLVGSIGEALAAYYYGLELLTASSKGEDARWKGLSVEIKATQGSGIALRHPPAHLLVLKLHPDGTWTEAYNGPGDTVWNLCVDKKRPSNGQYPVRLSRLKELMSKVSEDRKIPMVYDKIVPSY